MLFTGDLLYIGDSGTDSIEVFDADTGAHVSSLIDTSGSLHGPRGMVVQGNSLLVVNQNVNTPFSGEVLRFDLGDTSTTDRLIASSDDGAPFAPYGMVVGDNFIYVADTMDDGVSASGRVSVYDAGDRHLVSQFQPSGFEFDYRFHSDFRPRGLVFGPDESLYITASSKPFSASADPPGHIFRLDLSTGQWTIVAWNNGNDQDQSHLGELTNLHNPEGIVFGPDGKLYVTTNRTNTETSIDEDTHILVIDPITGSQLKDISLAGDVSNKNLTRTYAQSMIFGPGGKLFIPVAQVTRDENPVFGGSPTVVGGVLAYDSASGVMSSFVTPSYDGSLGFPYYATFGNTNSATLNYEPEHSGDLPQSHVAELPRYSGTQFDVHWDLDSDPGGTARFDILVSTNGGLYTKWLEDTTNHQGRFQGQSGVRYDFISIAKVDSAQVEMQPLTADASTVATQAPWQNPVGRYDVAGVGEPARASSVLKIINYLAIHGSGTILPEPTAAYQPIHGGWFWDVSGDGKVTALDALQVINELARLRAIDG